MSNGIRSLVLVVVFFYIVIGLFIPTISAADLTNRSVTLGTSTISATTSYNFRFNIPTVNTVGSILIEFCDTSPLFSVTCVVPSGVDASAAVLASQTGEVGFIIDPLSTATSLLLSRVPSLTSVGTATYNFNNIVSRDSTGTSYIRISTYSSVDATGSIIDSGGLAYALNRSILTTAFVPPYLTFCTGVTVAGDCSSSSGQFLSFGELSTLTPKYLTSQYAGATNDPGGFTTTMTGLTMTSGTNVIPALNVPTASIPGTSQFGMNLRANTNPAVGSNRSGIGTSTATVDYNTPDIFTFKNQTISSSPISTDFNVFTVSYIVNIASGQNPGVYNTTLTYIATAAF